VQVTSEPVATREVVLPIEPDAETVQAGMRKAAQQLSRWRPVPGYRPGKAPYNMVERIFGKEMILNQAVDDMANTLYRQALEQEKLDPYEQGTLEVASQEPLVIKVRVPLMPTVTLGDYTSIKIEPEPDVVVTNEQIDEQVEIVRRRHAQYQAVERPAQMGDQIVASIKGVSEGETVVDNENTTLELSDELVPPGFAEALVGMAAEETRVFSLAYPDDHEDERLRGKTVEFNVKLTTVREILLPEVNDDLAKTAGDYATLDEMREGLAANLKQRLEREARNREAEKAIEALVNMATIEYPAAALEREVQATLDNQKARLQQIGFSFENYLRMTGHTEAQLREEIRPDAAKRLARNLALNELARAEKLEVSGEELGNAITGIAASYGDRAEQAMRQFSDMRMAMPVYAELLTRKAINRLVSLATGRAEQAESAEAASADTAGAEANTETEA